MDNRVQSKTIIVASYAGFVEYRTSLRTFCKEHNLPYHSIKSLSFPIEWEGWTLQREPIDKKVIDIDSEETVVKIELMSHLNSFIYYLTGKEKRKNKKLEKLIKS